jgi:CheY-like chemotaxis protein
LLFLATEIQPTEDLRETALPQPPARKALVLIVDDDAHFARGLTRLLTARCEVTLAASGREGLDHLLAASAAWDLVLCDVMMPGMNGMELYTVLRERAPLAAARLVFVTGGATTEATAAFLGALPNVLLQKPFDIAQVLGLVEARLAQALPEARLLDSEGVGS